MADEPELKPVPFLRDLAERLRSVPVMYGTDDYDISRLLEIAKQIEEERANG